MAVLGLGRLSLKFLLDEGRRTWTSPTWFWDAFS
jgi:hypothetical protein